MKNETVKVNNGIHHIAITVKDFDKSIKFYTKGLGFSVFMSWGDENKEAAMLDTGNGSFVEIFSNAKSDRAEGSWQHLALNSNDCDISLNRARDHGAIVTMEPADIDIQLKNGNTKHVRIAFCKGPDNEIIEFFQTRQLE